MDFNQQSWEILTTLLPLVFFNVALVAWIFGSAIKMLKSFL